MLIILYHLSNFEFALLRIRWKVEDTWNLQMRMKLLVEINWSKDSVTLGNWMTIIITLIHWYTYVNNLLPPFELWICIYLEWDEKLRTYEIGNESEIASWNKLKQKIVFTLGNWMTIIIMLIHWYTYVNNLSPPFELWICIT